MANSVARLYRNASAVSRPVCAGAGLWVLVGGPGCVAELHNLRAEVTDQRALAGRNAELAARLERNLARVEQVLRRNQADLGLRVQELEGTTQRLEGRADTAGFETTAVRQELVEVRRDVDGRLVALEDKVDRVTNIPDRKDELLAAAQKLFDEGSHAQARRLFRLYESRYPDDAALPMIRFRIGHSLFSERKYKSSLGEFYRVVEESPDSPFVYDALYYLGIAYGKIGQCANATAYFQALRDKLEIDRVETPQGYDRLAQQQLEILSAGNDADCLDAAPPAAQGSPR